MNFKRAVEASISKLLVKVVRFRVDSENALTRRLETENNLAVSAKERIYEN